MARRAIAICLAATIMVLVLWGEAAAQSSDCTNTLISLSPCLDYITGNTSKPSSRCCSKLGTVVKSQPECLCQVLKGGGSSMGIIVNQTRALILPGACDVKTPSISSCNDESMTNDKSPNPKRGCPKVLTDMVGCEGKKCNATCVERYTGSWGECVFYDDFKAFRCKCWVICPPPKSLGKFRMADAKY